MYRYVLAYILIYRYVRPYVHAMPRYATPWHGMAWHARRFVGINTFCRYGVMYVGMSGLYACTGLYAGT